MNGWLSRLKEQRIWTHRLVNCVATHWTGLLDSHH